MKAQTAVACELGERRAALRMRAEKVVDLAERDDDRDARCKAGDDRRRYERGQIAEMQHCRDDQHDAGEKGRHEHALHAVGADQRAEDGRHRAGRTRDLIISAGERRDHETRNDRRDQTTGRRSAGGHAERQSERQSDRRDRESGHQILRQLFAVIACKFPSELLKKAHSHFHSPYRCILTQKNSACRCGTIGNACVPAPDLRHFLFLAVRPRLCHHLLYRKNPLISLRCVKRRRYIVIISSSLRKEKYKFRSNFFSVLWQTQKRLPRQPFLTARQSSLILSGGAAFPPRRPTQYSYGGICSAACRRSW